MENYNAYETGAPRRSDIHPPPPRPCPSLQVHKQLLLSVLRCEDIDDNPTGFRILHPLKSFAVTAESPQAKTQWVRRILLRDTTPRDAAPRRYSHPAQGNLT